VNVTSRTDAAGPSSPRPAVSVVIPCRNERLHIARCLESLLAQEQPPGGFELVIADGMSTDGTRTLLSQFARDARVRVIDNPGQIVSTGLNAAVAVSRGDVIIRADVHTEYAPDYVRQCVHTLETTGADNVGGPWVAVPQGYVGRAIAAAFHSRFGSGGARAHDPHYEGAVDTVYLGCWRRANLERLGGFDEELVRNQDDELNFRIVRSGGRVWQSPRIRSWYHPRNSVSRLFRQYLQYGYWKVRVIRKHGTPASWRHVVPAAFVGTAAVLLVLAPVSATARLGALVWIGAYLAATCVASVAEAARSGWSLLPILPVVFSAFHIGYGLGFLLGIIDTTVLRRRAARWSSALTRASADRS